MTVSLLLLECDPSNINSKVRALCLDKLSGQYRLGSKIRNKRLCPNRPERRIVKENSRTDSLDFYLTSNKY